MRKLRTLLTLLVLSICSMQSIWASRIAPELPTAQTLESGTTYYLYNVMEGKFACRSTNNTSYVALSTYGEKVTITATENEGEYTIQWASNNHYYWAAFDTYITAYYTSYIDSYNNFTIAESSKGYTIQRSSSNTTYYKSDEYIGFNGNNGDRLNPALAEGSIHWVLYSVDDAEYYMAKHKLYTYLEVADQNNFYITQYDLVYNNPDATTAELDQAQLTLENALNLSQNLVSPDWTEYPILFQNTTDNKWELDYYKTCLRWGVSVQYGNSMETTSTLKATVNVDADATMCYTYRGNWYGTLRVYLDGELVQIIYNSRAEMGDRRYYIEMAAGKHDITWECLFNIANSNGNTYYQYLSEIGVMNTPTITPATTTVEGQLGTEVLKLVDPVSSVKKIVINGVIGADDWTTIGLMVNAFSIDMSGATATAPMPDEMFRKQDNKWNFLHDVKLPEGLTAIGERAFYESDIENEMDFPSSLTSIGSRAFYGSKLKAAYMKDGITSIGSYAFQNCYFLENVTYPATAASVPYYCFENCYNLRTFEIPEGVTEINEDAFYACWRFNPRFPSSINKIRARAFYNTSTDSLFVNEDVTVDEYAFANCGSLVYAEWPTTFVNANYNNSPVVANCSKLNKVMLKSPTIVTYDSQDFFQNNNLSNITLQVPDFLESAYKLDPYWYQCNVQGFNSADITNWNVTESLVLNSGQRIGGTPNLRVTLDGNLTVNGDDTQNIGDLCINYSPIKYSWYTGSYSYNVKQQWGMMLGNTNNVNITGELSEVLRTKEKTWYFLTLPFDTKVGDITTTANDNGAATSYAIRYYDGATRANNGTGGNWKNYTAEDIIPAGTGFIYQTAKAASSKFVAQENASKQYILSNNEFVKALDENPSAVTANKGWNLVGNPWQTYYNIHKLNFTAPITVWDMDDKKYVAYSIIDDDYAIKPLEAIFVQCPDEINSISFPIDGRQLTTEIESQNGARALMQEARSRQLIDVELTDGELTDKTRVVMNPQASTSYEINCDASKFFSMDANVPQIFSIEGDTQYAINERPADNGIVCLGVLLPADGTYTINVSRNELTGVVLYDKQTGRSTDLSIGDYTFNGDAGLCQDRFELRFGEVNGIKTIGNAEMATDYYFNLKGQRVDNAQGSMHNAQLKPGIYVVKGKKVVVK